MNTKFVLIGRILLGLIFTISGLNGLLHFFPMPPLPEPAGQFMGALANTGYMFPLIMGTEVIGGLLLLVNIYPSLALILLAPVVVNILVFHIVLAPEGLPVAILLFLLEIFLAWAYHEKFLKILERKQEV
jgi:putative oxidoreductase